MTDKNDQSPPNSYPQRRRSSFAGQAFADMFSRSRNSEGNSPPSNSPPNHGPITSAAAEAASRRRLSLSTMGLSGSPTQGGSSFPGRARRESISSPNAPSIDESAVDDEPMSASASQPSGPFARRVSFGARALKDMKGGAGVGGGGSGPNGRASTSTIAEEGDLQDGEKRTFTPTSRLGRGEGFNWADNMRIRAERGSISGMSTSPNSSGIHHARAKSVAVMDTPIRDSPKPVNVPDQFQERILKGDFYMD